MRIERSREISMRSPRHQKCIVGSLSKTSNEAHAYKRSGSELLRFVHKPQLIRMSYSFTVDMVSPLYKELSSQLMTYDMHSDPYVLDLVKNSSRYKNVTKKLQDAYFKQATYCFNELKTLVAKYKATAAELGVSVADWSLQQCIARYQKRVGPNYPQFK